MTRAWSPRAREWQVHLLSFEGPDSYARAGGLASRIVGLAGALSEAGCDTHLWFIGDPELPGTERVGALTLHRWGQWISRYHPGGVYDGEEGKRLDYSASLPPVLLREMRRHLARRQHRVAVLAEEWQTVGAVLHVAWLLGQAGLRDRVQLFWNANNAFGFDRIDWRRLAQAATITTVSRYMRQRMWSVGVDPLVIPNGLPADALEQPDPAAVHALSHRWQGRLVLSKVARWDPDKRWLLAVDTVAELKRTGWRPLLVARGGVEAHGRDVAARAATAGLTRIERPLPKPGASGLREALGPSDVTDADIVVLTTPLDREASQLLFAASGAVLANSGIEPFGLVGLEAMAAGGLVCVGGTGEDYAVPGWNALVLQTNEPAEFLRQYRWLARHPAQDRALRRNGVATASRFSWRNIVTRIILPRLGVGFPTAAQRDGVRAQRPRRRRLAGAGSARGAGSDGTALREHSTAEASSAVG